MAVPGGTGRTTAATGRGESRETRVLREPVFQRKSGGEETPVRISAKAPAITGVLVVAEGGADPKIQQALGCSGCYFVRDFTPPGNGFALG